MEDPCWLLQTLLGKPPPLEPRIWLPGLRSLTHQWEGVSPGWAVRRDRLREPP